MLFLIILMKLHIFNLLIWIVYLILWNLNLFLYNIFLFQFVLQTMVLINLCGIVLLLRAELGYIFL